MTMMNTRNVWRDLKRPVPQSESVSKLCRVRNDVEHDEHGSPVTAIPTRRSPKRFVIRSPPFSKTRSNLGFDRLDFIFDDGTFRYS